MNPWFVKSDKNTLKFAFRFYAFPKIPKMLETDVHRKFNFQHYCGSKMSQTIVFIWSNSEITIPRNIVFMQNRKIKMPRKFLALKYVGEKKMISLKTMMKWEIEIKCKFSYDMSNNKAVGYDANTVSPRILFPMFY